jgi:hypothetical protein
MFFTNATGLLLRIKTSITLEQVANPTAQIYWDIEKYLTKVNNITNSYTYTVPPTNPITSTTEPNSEIVWWDYLGWILLIGGAVAIFIGFGKWSKPPDSPPQ